MQIRTKAVWVNLDHPKSAVRTPRNTQAPREGIIARHAEPLRYAVLLRGLNAKEAGGPRLRNTRTDWIGNSWSGERGCAYGCRGGGERRCRRKMEQQMSLSCLNRCNERTGIVRVRCRFVSRRNHRRSVRVLSGARARDPRLERCRERRNGEDEHECSAQLPQHLRPTD